MGVDTTFAVVLVGGVGGIAVLGATAIAQVTTVVAQRRAPAEAAPLATDPTVWRACHHPACGHLQTPHDPSPVGPACRDCTKRTETL